MITNASDLLSAFIAREVQKLSGFDMPHMPTLGSAYEAITKVGIAQRFILPPGLDLRVVSGFIDGSPNQFDCMLVQGEGRQYGLTDQFLYPIERVLCVFEVKKHLTKSELSDAIAHLATVQKLFAEDFVQRYESGELEPDVRRAARSFAHVTGRTGPESIRALGRMGIEDRALFGSLVRQQHAPVTVLWGFGGYSTEHGLRKALLDILEADAGQSSNASVDLLPTLITANTHSLIKCNHQPYILRRPDGQWVFVASTRHNPARILLELLWTKISNYFGARMPWGDDMELETLQELLTAQAAQLGDTFGWKYRSFEYSEKRLERPATLEWEPALVSKPAMTLVSLVGARGGSIVLDQQLSEYIAKEHNVGLDEVVQELIDSSAFGKSGDELHAIGPTISAGEFDDGRGVIALERVKLESWCRNRGLNPLYMTILVL